jgi:hypothetical protein
MDHPESSDYEGRISRRKALKRIGAGAAIAWSAPIMTSLRTPAFAQGSPPGCRDCAPLDCNNPRYCAPLGTGCCEESGCPAFCTQTIHLECLCTPSPAWNTPPDPPICTTDADCQDFNPRMVCINMNPNCNASGNKGCAAPCLAPPPASR